MRLAVSYIGQETNTFNPQQAVMADFESFGLYRGQELLDKLVGVGPVGGFLAAVEASGRDVEVVPLMKAHAVAGGRVADDVIAALAGELTERLAAVGELDGVRAAHARRVRGGERGRRRGAPARRRPVGGR